MAHGFVYLLGNRAMPTFFKIGCTERAPHARAKELSQSSGVPEPFHVLLYVEVDDFQRVEQRIHQELGDFRWAANREFFRFRPEHMNWLWCLFENFPGVLGMASPDWHRYAAKLKFPEDHIESWIDGGAFLCMPESPPINGFEEFA